jgi:hypothetical protein
VRAGRVGRDRPGPVGRVNCSHEGLLGGATEGADECCAAAAMRPPQAPVAAATPGLRFRSPLRRHAGICVAHRPCSAPSAAVVSAQRFAMVSGIVREPSPSTTGSPCQSISSVWGARYWRAMRPITFIPWPARLSGGRADPGQHPRNRRLAQASRPCRDGSPGRSSQLTCRAYQLDSKEELPTLPRSAAQA